MPKNNNNEELNQVAQVLSAMPTNGPNNEIQQKLMELLLKRLAKQEQTEEDERTTFEAARKTVREAQLKGWEQEKERRKQCSHKKPYGESAIAGQRLHSHSYAWICQYCAESWIDGKLPSELRISGEKVGGPEA